MASIPNVDDSDESLRRRGAEPTRPRESECLCCYVTRQLDEFPCDGSLRHALRYRDVVAPLAKDLAKRLGRMGGYCDCEVLMNGYGPREGDEDDDVATLPRCSGVRSGTVEPCGNWVRLR
jgi:Protein of unknown function (DUF2695)